MKKTNQKPNGKYQKKSTKRPLYIAAILMAVAVLAAALTLGYLYLGQDLDSQTIMDRVFVAGVDVGGMTKDEAIQAVRNATSETYTEKSMHVTILSHSLSLDPSLSNACLDVEAAVELAYAYGRSGSAGQNTMDQLQAIAGQLHVDILPFLNLDTAAIQAELTTFTARFHSQLKQPSYQIAGTTGEDKTLTVTVGTPGYDFVWDDLYNLILTAYNRNYFQVEYTCKRTEPDTVDLDTIYKDTYIEASDSTIDPNTFEATAHTVGYSFDLESAKAQLANAEYGQVISIPYLCTVPELTQEALDALLFRDVLASYTAKASSSENRDTNLRLACQAVNGIILASGQTFDYNIALGKRTEEKGYRYAASYYGNKTIDTIGGGICQVSSTLYYCALMSDLEIVTRINHGFLNTYVPMGMDATVSWGGPEFRFRNNRDYPIRIEASASGGHVTIKLLGTDTRDYYVKMQYEVLETTDYEIIQQEMPMDNEDGYRDGDTIVSPYTGYKVVTYRCKYDKQTDRLLSKAKETVSIYNKRDHIVCKIAAEDPSTPPEETTLPPEETTLPPEETTVSPTEPDHTTPEDTTPETSTSPAAGGTVTEDG